MRRHRGRVDGRHGIFPATAAGQGVPPRMRRPGRFAPARCRSTRWPGFGSPGGTRGREGRSQGSWRHGPLPHRHGDPVKAFGDIAACMQALAMRCQPSFPGCRETCRSGAAGRQASATGPRRTARSSVSGADGSGRRRQGRRPGPVACRKARNVQCGGQPGSASSDKDAVIRERGIGWDGRAPASAKAEEGQDCEDDDNKADKVDDVVQSALPSVGQTDRTREERICSPPSTGNT